MTQFHETIWYHRRWVDYVYSLQACNVYIYTSSNRDTIGSRNGLTFVRCQTIIWNNDDLSLHGDVIKWKHFPRYWPGHWWILHTKASDAEFSCFLWSPPWINGWVNGREAGELRLHRAHYDVIVMNKYEFVLVRSGVSLQLVSSIDMAT